MTKKIKRSNDYCLTLDITNESFLNTPRASQRTWILNRLLKEASDDLEYLDSVSGDLIVGADTSIELDREQSLLVDEDIMEDWQIPIMKKMAEFVASAGGDVLEIGMGRGVASDFIQSHKPNSHTLIECNDLIVQAFSQWRSKYPDSEIRMVHGTWQDKWAELDTYDGILFHTYPLTHAEFVETVVQSTTFAEHFFEPAAQKLRKGGVLSYLTNENDSLSRAHQRSLFDHFSSVSLSRISNLNIPTDTRDSCWLPQMVLIEAYK